MDRRVDDAVDLPAGRYGPAPGTARRRAVIGISVLAAAATAVVLWLGVGAMTAPVTWKDVGYDVVSDGEVEIVFDVVRYDPGAVVQCRVQALNRHYAQVGVVTADVAPGDRAAQRERVTVATTERAVTGLVESCWVASP